MIDIQKLITTARDQETKNNQLLHITASEGCMSETARQFFNWRISERYYYGPVTDEIMDNGKFTALALNGVTDIVTRAEKAACKMLGAGKTMLYCLSGVHAMMCAILSTTEPGDGVLTIRVEDGGHFATKPIVDIVGRKHHYAVFNQQALKFDAEKTAKTFKDNGAKVLYLDMSYYLNPHNLRELREALGDDAVIIYDASHTLGLIFGGTFQDPLSEGADVICANTHKTLPGPQKGMVVYKNKDFGELALQRINFKLFSNPHIHHLLALSITILEMEEYGKSYAKQIISNSNILAESLEFHGYECRRANTGRITENHQFHMFIDELGPTNKTYQKLLGNGFALHFNKVLGGRDFIRFGTQELTRRGMKENDMKQIADYINRAISGENVRENVLAFKSKFTKIHYSFDQLSKP